MQLLPRRRLAPLALAVTALAGGLTACGDEAEPSSGPEPSTSDSGAFPVDVEHALGTATVPEKPQRIVVVGLTEQDFLLALGETPVGVTEWYGEQPFATWPWAQDALGDAEPTVLTQTDNIDFEGVAALEPDLILGLNAGLEEDSYDKLSKIAPTIANAKGGSPYFSEWRDMTRLIGKAVGKSEEAEQVVADVEAKFAEAAAAHPEFAGKKIVFLQNAFYEGEAIAYQNGLGTEFLTDLGFEVPAELDEFATDDGAGQAYIPMEQLSTLDVADVLLWATEEPSDREALEAEPLYAGLEEVEDGHLVFTDGVTAGAVYFSSPLSLPFVVDQLVPALASTIAGDGPATIDSTK